MKFLVFTFSLLLHFSVWAQTLNSTPGPLTFDFGPCKQLEIGEPCRISFFLTEEQNTLVENIESLDQKRIFSDLFYVSNVEKFPVEGERKVQVFLTLIPLRNINANENPVIELENYLAPVLFQNLSITGDDKGTQEFLFYKEDFLSKRMWTILKIILSVGLIVLLGGAAYYQWVYKKRENLKKFKAEERERNRVSWTKKINEASTRREWEEIARDSNLWMPILEMPQDDAVFREFLKAIEVIQYKKDWSDFEKHTIEAAMEKIKKRVTEIANMGRLGKNGI